MCYYGAIYGLARGNTAFIVQEITFSVNSSQSAALFLLPSIIWTETEIYFNRKRKHDRYLGFEKIMYY